MRVFTARHYAERGIGLCYANSVYPSVRVSRLLDGWTYHGNSFNGLIGSSFEFFVTKGRCVNLRSSPPMGAPN